MVNLSVPAVLADGADDLLRSPHFHLDIDLRGDFDGGSDQIGEMRDDLVANAPPGERSVQAHS